ncbi:putative cytochrome p450 protein [Neofusicoccum parvum]|uniref:Cytochrome p450 protein n=1 Tax=Neofusicoccum parvum TaxID=310453 RepID=A0ACB5SK75_9PEZI|nr:putative cytochrome p450 protein [Neofusicoccum parvum]
MEDAFASDSAALKAMPFLISSLVIGIGLKLVYNIYFHPCRKFPGPKLAAITDLVYYYHVWQGTVVSWVDQVHCQYGDVARVGPDRISYTKPEAWKSINGHRTRGQASNTKDDRFYPRELNGIETIINAEEDSEHSRIRKNFTHAFSDKALKQQEHLIRKYVDKLIGLITKTSSAGSPVDVTKLYNYTTFDVMADLTFGEPLGLLDRSAYTPWVEATFNSLKISSLMRLPLEFPVIKPIIDFCIPQYLKEMRERHWKHSVDRVNKRMQNGNDQPDIWSFVVSTDQTDKGLTLDEMHGNAANFMIAGTETTATTLSGITYFLLRNPDKMKKLVEEIRALSAEDLNLETLPKLKYMSACLEESLRMYPPLPIAAWRKAPLGGSVICGEWVPERTRLGVSQYSAYHSPANFRDPDDFVPERWLPDSGFDGDKKDAFQPFSFGPRNCIGKNLAYHEMRIILASVLWHFDLELCSECDGWIRQKVWTVWEKPALFVRFKPKVVAN